MFSQHPRSKYPRVVEESRDSDDHPPFSRIFIVGCKNITKEILEKEFSKFGPIQYAEVKRDGRTREPKGIYFVKFVKTSSAAKAVEEMNGKFVVDTRRPIRVTLAKSKEGWRTDSDEMDEQTTRLFLKVPTTMREDMLQEEFNQFGEVHYVTLVRDKRTEEPKGSAIIKFYKFSHAALALENCDRNYMPKFAEPRNAASSSNASSPWGTDWKSDPRFGAPERNSSNSGFGGASGRQFSLCSNAVNMRADIDSCVGVGVNNPGNNCRVKVKFNSTMSKEMFNRLFSIVPGMVNFNLVRLELSTGVAIGKVLYSNPQAASYAVEKIDNFEIPTGFWMRVRLDDEDPYVFNPSIMQGGWGGTANNYSVNENELPADVVTLVKTIRSATDILTRMGFGKCIYEMTDLDVEAASSCKLPPRQPMAPNYVSAAERLFFVLPELKNPPPSSLFIDLFSRFGNLIEAYCLFGKKCGYAKFATVESAQRAIDMLHLSTFLGSPLRVEKAEPERSNKRRHPEEEYA